MPAISDLDSLQMSRLRSLRSEQQAQSARMARLEHLTYQVILPAMIRPGAPSSSGPNPPPTPGTPSSILSPALMKRARDLGDLVRRLSTWIGLVKGIISVVGVILPMLWLAAVALWKLAAPFLWRLWHLL